MKRMFLTIVALVTILPLALILLLSLFSYYRFPLILPKNLTFGYWQAVLLNNPLFFSSLLNSIIIAAGNGLLSSIVGMMTARALVRYSFKGKAFIKGIYLIPLFIPALALFLGVHDVMLRLKLINSYIGIIIAHMLISIPYATSIFIGFFKGIDPQLESAARVLGCNTFDLYRRVILPLMAPGIFLAFSIGFLISYTEYFSSFLIGGGRVITFATLMYPYISNYDIGIGGVMGVIFIGSNLLVFYIAEYISRRKLKLENYLFD